MKLSYESDEEAMSVFKKGDVRAFDYLYKKYLRRIKLFIYNKVGNINDAEELAQDTFMRMMNSSQTYIDEKKFTTWLFTIAKNHANNFLRKKGISRRIIINLTDYVKTDQLNEIDYDHLSFYTDKDQESNIDWIIRENEIKEAQKASIESLKNEYKETFLMRTEEKIKYEDIAEIKNIPVGTAKSTMLRAKGQLATKLLEMDVVEDNEWVKILEEASKKINYIKVYSVS